MRPLALTVNHALSAMKAAPFRTLALSVLLANTNVRVAIAFSACVNARNSRCWQHWVQFVSCEYNDPHAGHCLRERLRVRPGKRTFNAPRSLRVCSVGSHGCEWNGLFTVRCQPIQKFHRLCSVYDVSRQLSVAARLG